MEPQGAATWAILFGVYATLALDTYSTLCSSPQTTELFAEDREPTLMKYVYIADGAALGTGVVVSVATGNPWPLIGSAVVVLGLHLLYRHAVAAGQKQEPPA